MRWSLSEDSNQFGFRLDKTQAVNNLYLNSEKGNLATHIVHVNNRNSCKNPEVVNDKPPVNIYLEKKKKRHLKGDEKELMMRVMRRNLYCTQIMPVVQQNSLNQVLLFSLSLKQSDHVQVKKKQQRKKSPREGF